jgi:hypothetical protein
MENVNVISFSQFIRENLLKFIDVLMKIFESILIIVIIHIHYNQI